MVRITNFYFLSLSTEFKAMNEMTIRLTNKIRYPFFEIFNLQLDTLIRLATIGSLLYCVGKAVKKTNNRLKHKNERNFENQIDPRNGKNRFCVIRILIMLKSFVLLFITVRSSKFFNNTNDLKKYFWKIVKQHSIARGK